MKKLNQIIIQKKEDQFINLQTGETNEELFSNIYWQVHKIILNILKQSLFTIQNCIQNENSSGNIQILKITKGVWVKSKIVKNGKRSTLNEAIYSIDEPEKELQFYSEKKINAWIAVVQSEITLLNEFHEYTQINHLRISEAYIEALASKLCAAGYYDSAVTLTTTTQCFNKKLIMILDHELNNAYYNQDFQLSQELAHYLEEILLLNQNLESRQENLIVYFQNHYLNYKLQNIPSEIHQILTQDYLNIFIQILLNFSLNKVKNYLQFFKYYMKNAAQICSTFIQEMIAEIKAQHLQPKDEITHKTFLSLKSILQCLSQANNQQDSQFDYRKNIYQLLDESITEELIK